jgi:hypothetical protein
MRAVLSTGEGAVLEGVAATGIGVDGLDVGSEISGNDVMLNAIVRDVDGDDDNGSGVVAEQSRDTHRHMEMFVEQSC